MNFKKTLVYFLLLMSVSSLLSLIANVHVLNSGFKVGFPFTFYWKFKARGSHYNNYSWFIEKGMINIVIYLVLSFGIVYVLKKINKNYK